MISVTIYRNENQIIGFRCSGHSGYADSGSDIICAGVSALVINTINAIETFLKIPFQLETEAGSGLIDFRLEQTGHDTELLLRTMVLGLKGIQKDYGNEYIILDYKEV